MVGNKLEQEILGLYADTTAAYSINEIAKLLKKKYPYINKKVNLLLSAGILKKTVIGRSYLCSINLECDEAIILLSLNEARKKASALKRDKQLKIILDRILQNRKILSVKTILLVKNELIIAVNKSKVSATRYKMKTRFLDEESFYSYLLQNKDALTNRVILYSSEKYYECIKELEPKLQIKYSKYR